ncbi:tetraspanin-18-like isoform X3 [Babylonia areolata]|uniref:tetraspanin-18-like isoform X3 n=1 Tax=Babylonia areolata TaxID=304850 RepID=UPI003FCF36FB
MPFKLCPSRNHPARAAQRILPPEVIEELSKPLRRQRSTRSNRSNASRRRQNEDACTTCLRGTLHCYNVCILVIGCAALGVGVWLLVTDFGARNVTPIVGNDLYEVTTYLLIAGGGAVALLAFCGCCGTIREDKCVLSFYGTTLAVVLIVLGIACGIAFFFRGAISVNIQTRMKNSLTMHYGIDTRTNVENRRITESWDAMQRQLQCCGIAGNTTSKYSWSFYSQGTEWQTEEDKKSYHSYRGGKSDRRRVPESCCAKGDIQLCTGQKDFDGPPLFFDSHHPKYQEVNPFLYTTGCYDKLIDYLRTYTTVVGCVAAVVPIFLIFGIAVSFCLCARVAGIASDEEVEL